VLVIGGEGASVGGAVESAFPGVVVERVADWFEGLSRLHHRTFDALLADASQIRRRPDAALRRLRDAAGESRVVLMVQPTDEPLARKITAGKVGGATCDEYVVLPVSPMELVQALTCVEEEVRGGVAVGNGRGEDVGRVVAVRQGPGVEVAVARGSVEVHGGGQRTGLTVAGLAVAEIVLEALVREPGDAAGYALKLLNGKLPAGAHLVLRDSTERDLAVPVGMTQVSKLLPRVGPSGAALAKVPVSATSPEEAPRVLHLQLERSFDEQAGRELLEQIAPQIAKVLELQDRHTRLQKIAITDDLTGLHNCRYFKHFLEKTLVKAKEQRFPVTLLLFDIDNFKKYNDTYGHAVGDEILRQTGKMMRRCVRDHDLVARLGGDEFAVVFWEKDGPRQPLANGMAAPVYAPGRPPQSPVIVFQRFKKLIASHDFEALGPSGKGQLTISGGLAVYPYDAHSAEELIEAADKALMFGAKKSGKNTLSLVGDDEVG
jgi:GGDEF domain-containing protein/CheY-like chemotaxis protein